YYQQHQCLTPVSCRCFRSVFHNMPTHIKTEEQGLAMDSKPQNTLCVTDITSESLVQKMHKSSLNDDNPQKETESDSVLYGQFRSMRDHRYEDAKLYYQKLRKIAGPREFNVCKADTVFRSMLLDDSLLPEIKDTDLHEYKPSTILRLGPAPPVHIRPQQPTKPSLLEIYLNSDLIP
ncbi:uncharacterized protein LOC115209773, partial [Argonauta hians]